MNLKTRHPYYALGDRTNGQMLMLLAAMAMFIGLAVGLSACGSSTNSDGNPNGYGNTVKTVTVNNVPCIIVTNARHGAVAISCDWPQPTATSTP